MLTDETRNTAYIENDFVCMFEIVDMRWGVRDEATDDHMTTELCLNEIDNCQRLSTGPNFCVGRVQFLNNVKKYL